MGTVSLRTPNSITSRPPEWCVTTPDATSGSRSFTAAREPRVLILGTRLRTRERRMIRRPATVFDSVGGRYDSEMRARPSCLHPGRTGPGLRGPGGRSEAHVRPRRRRHGRAAGRPAWRYGDVTERR